LFIDNYADAHDVLMEFKDYFEDAEYLKCWHNYGFDRHIMYNHGIDCKGFGGDTMHMARLADPSRMPGSYGLSALSGILADEIEEVKTAMLDDIQSKADSKAYNTVQLYKEECQKTKKVNIKETFGFYRELKDGQQGKILMFPDIEEMHTDPAYVEKWVEYSCFDAEITYFLRETLASQLIRLETSEEDLQNMLALYTKYWLPFGELLTDMERTGFKINIDHLKKI